MQEESALVLGPSAFPQPGRTVAGSEVDASLRQFIDCRQGRLDHLWITSVDNGQGCNLAGRGCIHQTGARRDLRGRPPDHPGPVIPKECEIREENRREGEEGN